MDGWMTESCCDQLLPDLEGRGTRRVVTGRDRHRCSVNYYPAWRT